MRPLLACLLACLHDRCLFLHDRCLFASLQDDATAGSRCFLSTVALTASSYAPNQAFRFAASRSQGGMQHNPSFGIPANTSSHGSESASPCPTSQKQKEAVNVLESSDSSEEEGRRGVRINWSENDNIRLMNAWLKHSVDPVHGNDKKTEHYWKAVADEYNGNLPSNGHKRTAKQCRIHWGNVRRDVTKFCGCISRAKSTFTSGYSDDMIKQTAHAWFKKGNKERSFTLEYIWKDLKHEPKWKRILQDGSKNKRNKISESGAYTSSSNQETEEETSKEMRPEGQRAARQRLKGKGAPSPLGDKPCQNMVLFHEAVTQRAAALLKSAEATVLSAEAKKESARAKQEKARAKKFSTYLKLSEKDTSKYNEKQLKTHNDILDKLGRELAEE